jgi:hypothetical protein
VVERARRDLQQRVLADRLARLGDEVDELLVVGEDRDRAGVLDDLALDLGPVGAPVEAGGDVDPEALVGDLAVESLHPRTLAPMNLAA